MAYGITLYGVVISIFTFCRGHVCIIVNVASK